MEIDSSDVVIVGSGPAGVAAALAFARRGIVATIVDVGVEQPLQLPTIEQNLYDYAAQNDVTETLLGKDLEGLYNLNPENQYVSYYLSVPKNRFVVSGADRWLPLQQNQTAFVQSLAKGGLANAWGCAAYRYNDKDLEQFPFDAQDLDPFYDLLTQEIGINGCDDDLTRFNGSTRYLQPPFDLPVNSSIMLQKYQRRKRKLNQHGFYLGRMRSAILTRDLDGRQGHPCQNTDLFSPLSSPYNPAYTLDKLIRNNQVRYLSGLLVEQWSKSGEEFEVHARRIKDEQRVTVRCKKLVLAAGAVNSSKIALRSFKDYATRLPLLDNPTVHIPLLLLSRIGKRLDKEGYGSASIAAVYDFEDFATPLHAPIFETMLVPRAEFFRHMPFSASFNALAMKDLLPAMSVMVLFLPSDASSAGTLGLQADGTVVLNPPREHPVPRNLIRRVIGITRKLGVITHHSLTDRLMHGGSIHYAGSLPMRQNSNGNYQTDLFGELAAEPGVFVVDGACLPALSAKNHTLTIMANSMRICTRIAASTAA